MVTTSLAASDRGGTWPQRTYYATRVTPGLSSQANCAKDEVYDLRDGEMSEWLKEHAWKACVGETLPWVRIPLSPPAFAHAKSRPKRELRLGKPGEGCLAEARSALADLISTSFAASEHHLTHHDL